MQPMHPMRRCVPQCSRPVRRWPGHWGSPIQPCCSSCGIPLHVREGGVELSGLGSQSVQCRFLLRVSAGSLAAGHSLRQFSLSQSCAHASLDSHVVQKSRSRLGPWPHAQCTPCPSPCPLSAGSDALTACPMLQAMPPCPHALPVQAVTPWWSIWWRCCAAASCPVKPWWQHAVSKGGYGCMVQSKS